MASLNSTARKAKYTKKETDGSYTNYHFETETDQVLVSSQIVASSDGATGLTISKDATLHKAITDIASMAVKGGQANSDLLAHKQDTSSDVHGIGSKISTASDSLLGSSSDSWNGTAGTSTTSAVPAKHTIYAAANLAQNALTSAQNAYSFASGKSVAHVYSSVDDLLSQTTVDTSSDDGKWFNVGDSIYITDTTSADFWIGAIGTSTDTSAQTASDTVKAVRPGGSVTVYWSRKTGVNATTVMRIAVTLYAFDTKQDLSSYALKTTTDSLGTRMTAAEAVIKTNSSSIATNKTNISNLATTVATNLTTAKNYADNKTVTLAGHASGSVKLSSTANTLTMTLASVLDGSKTYSYVNVDQYGRVTGGGNTIVFVTALTDSKATALPAGGIAIIEG
jgi:hypothetical protein